MSAVIARRALTFGLAASAASLALPAWGQQRQGGLIERRESQYNTIYVVRQADGQIGMIFGVNQTLFTESLYDPAHPRALPVPYTRFMTIGLAYTPEARSILEIGLGGGRTAYYLHLHMPASLITCVELDPAVIDLAQRHFGIRTDDRFQIVERDGRIYLNQDQTRRDLILVDAYRGTFVPFHLLTKEFFTLVKARLNPGGAVAQNIEPSTMLFDAAIATIADVFDTVELYEAGGNVVAIAYDGPRKPHAQLAARAQALQAQYGFRHPLPEMLGARRIVTGARAKPLTDDFAPVEALKAETKYNRKRDF